MAAIARAADAGGWPTDYPPKQTGYYLLPGTGRTVFWTGRVAIGLRHDPSRHQPIQPVPESQLWVQDVMLNHKKPGELRYA